MINKIIDGICIALNNEFGDSYEIYTESVEQGLKEPCFFINSLNPTNAQFLNNKYERTQPFCIQYFPSSSEKNYECNEVLEQLNQCLEYISVSDNLTRGTEMHGEMVDGILNYFIHYDFFVIKQEDAEERMGEFKHKSKVKG